MYPFIFLAALASSPGQLPQSTLPGVLPQSTITAPCPVTGGACDCGCTAGGACTCTAPTAKAVAPQPNFGDQKAQYDKAQYDRLYEVCLRDKATMSVYVQADPPEGAKNAVRWDGFPGVTEPTVIQSGPAGGEMVLLQRRRLMPHPLANFYQRFRAGAMCVGGRCS